MHNLRASRPQASARRVFEVEAASISALSDRLDHNFDAAIAHLLSNDGKVIVCGMGKSGIVGRKVAATLASTGTPSFFMHPGEAYHGDLGMVTERDTFVAISNSGETEEVIKLLPFLRECGNFLIALTGNSGSTLARASNCHLDVRVREEACPLKLAPTSSTTATLAMGDALAIALMEERGFQPEHFARFHPGGTLGRRLLNRVEHEMLTSDLPIVEASDSAMVILRAITSSNMGLTLVRDGSSWGLITDGDLRRGIERFQSDLFDAKASDLMTRSPSSVLVGTRMEDALAKMERERISALLVLDGSELCGILKK